jgi:hypothetical protein
MKKYFLYLKQPFLLLALKKYTLPQPYNKVEDKQGG